MTVHLNQFNQKEIEKLHKTLKENFTKSANFSGYDSIASNRAYDTLKNFELTIRLFGYTFIGDKLIQNTKDTNEANRLYLEA